jgi:hypothetical protein
MLIINFAHALPSTQLAEIERLAGQPIERAIDVIAQFNPAQAFALQDKAVNEV